MSDEAVDHMDQKDQMDQMDQGAPLKRRKRRTKRTNWTKRQRSAQGPYGHAHLHAQPTPPPPPQFPWFADDERITDAIWDQIAAAEARLCPKRLHAPGDASS